MTQGKYLFGPVPSCRFGRSVGVDLPDHIQLNTVGRPPDDERNYTHV